MGTSKARRARRAHMQKPPPPPEEQKNNNNKEGSDTATNPPNEVNKNPAPTLQTLPAELRHEILSNILTDRELTNPYNAKQLIKRASALLRLTSRLLRADAKYIERHWRARRAKLLAANGGGLVLNGAAKLYQELMAPVNRSARLWRGVKQQKNREGKEKAKDKRKMKMGAYQA